MSPHRQLSLLGFVLVALTCLTLLAPVVSVAQDRTEVPESTVSETPAEQEAPSEESGPPDDFDPQPTVPESDDEPAAPERELQDPVLYVNGAQSLLEVTDTTNLTAVASSLNEGASYSLTVSTGFGCGGGQQYGLGAGTGQLGADLGALAEGRYSVQAIDATNNLFSNCVDIAVVPAFVEKPTDEPLPTDEPPTEVPATEIPTEEPPTPTSEPPTTEPSAEPPTSEPTTEPSATETAELSPSPTAEPSPTPDASSTSEPSDFGASALPEETFNNKGLYINGSEGPVHITAGQQINILVEDFTNMADGRALYDESSTSMNWNAYSEVYVASAGCGAGGQYSAYTLNRQSNYTWTASTSFSTIGTYSFVARQGFNFAYLLGGSYGRRGTSICVEVIVSTSKPALAANGTTNLQVNEDIQVLFTATGIPSEAQSLELVQWSGGGCGLGSATVLTTNLPTGFDNLTGSNHFELKTYVAGTLWSTSNCVFVSVANVGALLRENGSTGPISFQTGQSFYLIATNFAPSAPLILSVYAGSGCSEASFNYRYTAGSADGEGTFVFSSFVGLSYEAASFSVQVSSPSETTNCVAFNRIQGSPRLTVNGSTGPFVVGEPTLFDLVATGLPPNVESHLITCSGTVLDEFGSTTSPQGEDSSDWLVEEEISLAFTAAGVTTNCIYFNYVDATEYTPVLTVNGGSGPETVAVDEPFDLAVNGLAADATFFMQRFPGVADCSGTPVDVASTATFDGQYAITTSVSALGDVSYRVAFGPVRSNCVAVDVAETTDILLAINGENAALSVDTSDDLALMASGLPGNVASSATALRQFSGEDCASAAPFNLATADTNGSGVLSLSLAPLQAGVWSFRLDLTDRPGISNCVNVAVSEVASTDPYLTINEFSGLVAVLEGDALEFEAGNLADPAGETVLNRYSAFGCSGAVVESIDLGGDRPASHAGTAPGRGRHSYRVTTSDPAAVTNCVNLLVSTPEEEVEPYLLIDDSFGPLQVEDGQLVVFNAAAFPTDVSMQLMAYTSEACSDAGSAWPGDSTQAANGGVFVRTLPVPGGVLGAKVTSANGETNCVALTRASVDSETGTVSVTIETADGQDIPDGGQVCLDAVCQSIGGADLAASAMSGSEYTFEAVAPGSHLVTVVGVQPYEDASASIEVIADRVNTETIVLQVVPVPQPTPGGTVEPSLPTPGPGSSSTPTPTPTPNPADPSTPAAHSVVGLPVTGAGTPGSGFSLLAIVMTGFVLAAIGALVARREKAG